MVEVTATILFSKYTGLNSTMSMVWVQPRKGSLQTITSPGFQVSSGTAFATWLSAVDMMPNCAGMVSAWAIISHAGVNRPQE
jgi:hypothetical protein